MIVVAIALQDQHVFAAFSELLRSILEVFIAGPVDASGLPTTRRDLLSTAADGVSSLGIGGVWKEQLLAINLVVGDCSLSLW